MTPKITPNQRTSKTTSSIPLLLWSGVLRGGQYTCSRTCVNGLSAESSFRSRRAVRRSRQLRSPLSGGGIGRYPDPCYDKWVRRAVTGVLLTALLVTAAACAVTRAEVQEWQGRIVEIDREREYFVVRSRERLIDHVFRITPNTEITSKALSPLPLETGQWVTVEYHKDGTQPGPPTALRIVVVQ
jgi:hypothetical protein